MAGHDAGRYDALMDWPLRDLFLAYVARLRDQARSNYELELLVWAMLAPHQKHQSKPPSFPAILRS